ncbi:uncharacterized protein K452DRAFT_290214 [Aplosporella prunicola CBS 121167]|uniref:Uncharacterized protein n=1 Tax=Aplosporella prunicola CBS 121167 TaxID=1176127 RepID=A0A6A6B657_9PEZI|nr:uncharacterized protein K452DRAFT_290214 [Aplosporella prunicola CBS 121167]KAF2139118.1 hypothetical protein K452DRAFT_290214 [Aplosporella prunicola CBS 121167]
MSARGVESSRLSTLSRPSLSGLCAVSRCNVEPSRKRVLVLPHLAYSLRPLRSDGGRAQPRPERSQEPKRRPCTTTTVRPPASSYANGPWVRFSLPTRKGGTLAVSQARDRLLTGCSRVSQTRKRSEVLCTACPHPPPSQIAIMRQTSPQWHECGTARSDKERTDAREGQMISEGAICLRQIPFRCLQYLKAARRALRQSPVRPISPRHPLIVRAKARSGYPAQRLPDISAQSQISLPFPHRSLFFFYSI